MIRTPVFFIKSEYDNICQAALKFYPPPDIVPTDGRGRKRDLMKNMGV
jgi:hypothetical protein